MNLTTQNITLQNIKNSDYLDLANIMIWGFKSYYGKHLSKIKPEFTEVKIGGKDVIEISFPDRDRTHIINIYKVGNVFAYTKDKDGTFQNYADHPLDIANWFLRNGFLAITIPLNIK